MLHARSRFRCVVCPRRTCTHAGSSTERHDVLFLLLLSLCNRRSLECTVLVIITIIITRKNAVPFSPANIVIVFNRSLPTELLRRTARREVAV